MKLKIYQVGEEVLRQKARPLSIEEILSPKTQQLIELMRETMLDAPGVGLAAPQIGLPFQLAVVEDREEKINELTPEVVAERERVPVPFHVIINPTLIIEQQETVEFFEGCLSLAGFTALVPRARVAQVECLNERGEPSIIHAQGWYARILQHEIDHLNSTLYIDRMQSRSFMSADNYARYWKDKSIEHLRAAIIDPQ